MDKFKEKIKNHPKKIECGIRINPEYSEIELRFIILVLRIQGLESLWLISSRTNLKGLMDYISIRCANKTQILLNAL